MTQVKVIYGCLVCFKQKKTTLGQSLVFFMMQHYSFESSYISFVFQQTQRLINYFCVDAMGEIKELHNPWPAHFLFVLTVG